jgi:hypothetical protein
MTQSDQAAAFNGVVNIVSGYGDPVDEFTEMKTIQMHLGPRSSWWARPR